MRSHLRLFALAALIVAAPARSQDEEGAFSIGGIAVDVAAKSATEARAGGWREAQRRAWPQLWSRLTGAPAVNAPKLGDSALDAIVQGIEVEHETIGPTRYMASLGIVFDRARASRYLGASARMLRSSPMLLLPVLWDGGTRTAFEKRTVWAAAWGRFRLDSSPVDYVRALGTAGDAVILTASQAYRPDRPLWRAALQRYAAADVLVAEARFVRNYPGGPVRAVFRALHGPDGEEIGRFTLAAASEAELPAMLDRAVRQMDALYVEALRGGRLKADEDLTVPLVSVVDSGAPAIGAASAGDAVELSVETADAAAASAVEAKIRAAPSVIGTALTSIVSGGTSKVRVTYAGRLEDLRYDLDQVGLRLERTRLRARREGEAPLPPPAPAAPDVGDAPVETTPGPPPPPGEAGVPIATPPPPAAGVAAVPPGL